MTTNTMLHVIERVATHTPEMDTRDASSVQTGQGFRQGDLYFIRLHDAQQIKTPKLSTRQLVSGTSRGSRHIMEGDVSCHEPDRSLMPDVVYPDALLSPIVVVGEKGATLTHPEHAHFSLPANSRWITWQQMDQRTKKRVKD